MELVVYKNQYGFSTLAKNGDVKIYIPVQFKKGMEPLGEKVKIKIENAFFSNYTDKNGLTKPKLVVMNYSEINEDNWSNSTTVLDDSTLPF